VPSPPLWVSMQVLYAHDPNPRIWPTSLAWLLIAFWLVLPTAIVLWVLLTIGGALRRGWTAAFHLPAYYWFFLAMYGFWAVLYLVKAPWMMMPFYATALTPLMLLSLGPLMIPLVDRLSSRSYAVLLSLMFLVVFLAYRFSDPRYANAAILLALACLSAAAVLSRGGLLPEAWRPTAVVALLVVALGGIDFATSDYSTQLRHGYKYTAMATIYPEPRPGARWSASRAEMFEGAIEASERLRSRLSGKYFYIGYDVDDPMGMYFRTVACFFFVWSSETVEALNEHFHGIDESTISTLAPQDDEPAPDLLIFTRADRIPLSDARLQLRWSEAFRTASIRYYAHYFVADVPPAVVRADR